MVHFCFVSVITAADVIIASCWCFRYHNKDCSFSSRCKAFPGYSVSYLNWIEIMVQLYNSDSLQGWLLDNLASNLNLKKIVSHEQFCIRDISRPVVWCDETKLLLNHTHWNIHAQKFWLQVLLRSSYSWCALKIGESPSYCAFMQMGVHLCLLYGQFVIKFPEGVYLEKVYTNTQTEWSG